MQCYCSWVDDKVDSDKMPESCNAGFIFGAGKCDRCEKSPQLEFMSAKDLLQNIYVK